MEEPKVHKEEIRRLWESGIAALEAGDWDAYSRVWAHKPHVEAIHPAGGEWWTGWQELEPKYRELIESGVEISAETRRIHINVSPSCDMAWATMETAIRVGSDERVSWQVAVFQKYEDGWRLVLGFDAPRQSN